MARRSSKITGVFRKTARNGYKFTCILSTLRRPVNRPSCFFRERSNAAPLTSAAAQRYKRCVELLGMNFFSHPLPRAFAAAAALFVFSLPLGSQSRKSEEPHRY